MRLVQHVNSREGSLTARWLLSSGFHVLYSATRTLLNDAQSKCAMCITKLFKVIGRNSVGEGHSVICELNFQHFPDFPYTLCRMVGGGRELSTVAP